MIAKYYEQSIGRQPAILQALEQFAQRLIAIMQRVAVAANLFGARKWARLRRVVGMMSCDRQIRDKELFVLPERIDPPEYSLNSRRLVYAKAGVEISPNPTCIFHCFITS